MNKFCWLDAQTTGQEKKRSYARLAFAVLQQRKRRRMQPRFFGQCFVR